LICDRWFASVKTGRRLEKYRLSPEISQSFLDRAGQSR
jgi:hypothetical protein